MIHCKSLEDVYERERIVINNYNLHFLTFNLLRIFNFIYVLSTHIHLFIILLARIIPIYIVIAYYKTVQQLYTHHYILRNFRRVMYYYKSIRYSQEYLILSGDMCRYIEPESLSKNTNPLNIIAGFMQCNIIHLAHIIHNALNYIHRNIIATFYYPIIWRVNHFHHNLFVGVF